MGALMTNSGTRETEYQWTLAMRGDGRKGPGIRGTRGDWTSGRRLFLAPIRDERIGRYNYLDHLAQVTRAAAVSGFSGVLVPFDPDGEESWVVSAALARESPSLTFVTEFSPAFATPVYATKMSTTFQRFSGGRLSWKLAIDQDPAAAARLGDHVQGSDRYARAAELLDIAEGIWGVDSFTYRGRFYEVEEGGLKSPLTGHRRPPVVLSGVGNDALALSAAHADVHAWAVLPGEELDRLRGSLDGQASARGRQVDHSLQLVVVARETEQEAWDEVRRQWAGAAVGPDTEFDELVVGPGLWTGFGRLGHAADTGIVGSYGQVAAYLSEAAEAGIGIFTLEASPTLEEAYRFGEQLAPLLPNWASARRAG
jgi:alkanesulfonate monooxygenase